MNYNKEQEQEQKHNIMHRLQLDWNAKLQYHFKAP